MLLRFSIAALLLAGATCAFSQSGVITTIAGRDFAFPPTPIPAVNAPIQQPGGAAFDAIGNLYLSDFYRIMKVDVNGSLTVIAGNGFAGFSGDGGPATSASLNWAYGVAVDSVGNVFFVDGMNYRVRKVAIDGTITTVAGNGSLGFRPKGVAVDGADNLLIADMGSNLIRKLMPDGTLATVAGNGKQTFAGDGGPATQAALYAPKGIAIDNAGNLFIADSLNGRVRRVDGVSGIITTVAGNGQISSAGDGGSATAASFWSPDGVAVDSLGNLYISDESGNRVRKVVLSSGIITTLAGSGPAAFSGDGGPAGAATLNFPSAVAVDASGTVVVCDYGNNRIRSVANDGTISTLVGQGGPANYGDGGPAINATLDMYLTDVVVDGFGNIFVNEPSRIRKIGTDNIITTVAGSGASSAEGVLATTAALRNFRGLAVDTEGSLYFSDTFNNRIRKVTPDGIITTIAGNGVKGSTGDGALAINAALNSPYGVAVDSAGTIYINDAGNARIRKVTNGLITTLAQYSGFGTGAALDASGNLVVSDGSGKVLKIAPDGTVSTFASLSGVTALTADNIGNVFVAIQSSSQVLMNQALGNHILKITSDGTISTVAWGVNCQFATARYDPRLGDGGPAVQSCFSPVGVAVDASGNVLIADGTSGRIRAVLATPPSLSADTQSLTFAGQSAGAIPPIQNVKVSALAGGVPLVGLPFTVKVSTDDGGSWLTTSATAAKAPLQVGISVDPFNLPAGQYTGTITIQSTYAQPGTITIPVTFAVSPAASPSLAIDRDNITYSFPLGTTARTQTIVVSNAGGGSVGFTATASTAAGGDWLAVSPSTDSATPSKPVPVSITADPAGKPAGTYSGTVVITDNSTQNRKVVNIVMFVSANPSAFLLSQTGFSFTAIQGGSTVLPPQNFGVLNLGAGPLDFTLDANTTATGGPWLAAARSRTTTQTPTVDVTVDPTGLSPATYYGLVKVLSPGAANSPQFITAQLQVLPSGSDFGGVLSTTALTFDVKSGTTPPGSQTVFVYNLTATPKSFVASASGDIPFSDTAGISGGELAIQPLSATVNPNQPVGIVVQPLIGYLIGPGNYHNVLTLQFDDGQIRTVDVNLNVGSTLATSAIRLGKSPASDATPCQPLRLIPSINSLGNGFKVAAGSPTALQAHVEDNCGNTLDSGSVIAKFDNGDPQLSLMALKGGRWDGTWKNGAGTAGVTLTLKATSADNQLAGAVSLIGGLITADQPPSITDQSVTNGATGIASKPLSPGTAINISGDQLADQNATADTVPFSTKLGADRVMIADQYVPLISTAPNQISAIIPYGLTTNADQQLVVYKADTISQPVSVKLADTSPAVFVVNGGPQGMILDASGNVVASGNAAHVNDTVTIYCTGLGALQSPVNAGDYGSATSATATPVTVSIGGQDAAVNFSGLAPNLVGIYWVQAVVPAGTTGGDQTPVVITSQGTPPSSSPMVTMAVQQ